jgi:hypothetical protein
MTRTAPLACRARGRTAEETRTPVALLYPFCGGNLVPRRPLGPAERALCPPLATTLAEPPEEGRST